MASSSRPPSLTLYSLTTSPHTHPSLPLLDPHSLYLATLLLVLCPSTTFCVRPPNLWLHKSLPRLEATGTGVVLAEGVKEVERWILNKSAGNSRRDGEEGEEGVDSDLALSSYLDRHIEPMVYSILFPPSTAQDDSATTSSSSSTPASFERIFTRLTFPSWSSNLPFPASRTLPHSVRKSVTSTLPREWRPSTRRHAHKQQRSSGASLSEEQGSPSTSSGRIPLGQPSRHAFWGFGREVKEDWSEEFEKKRLARQTRKAMAPVVSWLEASRRSEVSRERERERLPSAVEIRLFTLLAPLLLGGTDEVREVLRGHPVARSMLEEEEFAPLREWVGEEVERVWGGARSEWVGVRLGGAASEKDVTGAGLAAEGREEHRSADEEKKGTTAAPAATPTPLSSSSWRAYLPSFPSFPWRSTPASAADAAKPSAPSKPAEPPALRYGRYIWIGTAVLGTVGWLLASGVVSVSFEDDDDEEEGVEVGEGEEEDEEEEDEEDEGGWRFARGDGEGEDEEDDEDEEMVVDLDDDDDEYDE